MKLNSKKIRKILSQTGRNQAWLAEKLGISRQLMSYKLRSEHVNHVDLIAKAMGVNPKDLLK